MVQESLRVDQKLESTALERSKQVTEKRSNVTQTKTVGADMAMWSKMDHIYNVTEWFN
jgi:hypothetical protein